jgi:uncharacterized repeat protein (TIGR01451 family)
VEDEDASHYCNFNPAIDIEKATNGVDADDPDAGDAPIIEPGDPVTWTYVVTNIGNVDLFNVVVTDDQGATVICPGGTNVIPSLPVNATETCTANGIAEDVFDPGFISVPGKCGRFEVSPASSWKTRTPVITAISTRLSTSRRPPMGWTPMIRMPVMHRKSPRATR